jgi:hypothetical protein
MNILKRAFILAFIGSPFCIPGAKLAACGMDWTIPTNHFSGVNGKGYVAFWEKIGNLDFGDGLKVPLIIGFNSSRSSSSPYLGYGWTLALLESHLVQVNNNLFLMTLPNGFNVRLNRKSDTDSTLSGEGGAWMGEIGEHTTTLWADCGWKLVFSDGKLTSIITPSNQELTYLYQGGIVREIDKSGAPLLKVSIDQAGEVDGIDFNSRHISIAEAQKPYVERLNGQNVVGAVTPSLHTLTFPNGSSETFKFAVDASLQPTLEISGIATRSFTWDPATKFILKSGDWSYKIAPAESDGPFSNAQITRINSKGQSEYWYYDRLNGTVTAVGQDGVKRIREFFVSGLLFNKTRKITEVRNNVANVVYLAAYDEKGRLIRKVDHGTTTQYVYTEINGTSKLTQLIVNDKPAWTVSYDDKGNVANVKDESP